MSQRRSGSILATVLFVDLVSSTTVAEEMGNRRWQELLRRFHALARREIGRFGGKLVDTAGDGVFATFTSPADAIRCAAALIPAVRGLGLELRAGIHTGQIEVAGDKASGVGVHIGARVMAAASSGQILVTRTVLELTAGAGFTFQDMGDRSLKGVEGVWRISSVDAVDAHPLGPPAAEVDSRAIRDRIEPEPHRRRSAVLVAATVMVVVAVVATGLALRGGREPVEPPSSATAALAISDRVARLSQAETSADLVRSTAVAAGKDPSAIAVGEGAVWVANEGDATVTRIDPASGRGTTIHVPADPFAIAVGLGSVWVVERTTRTVSRIDPSSDKVTAQIDLAGAGFASTIAVGTSAVWVGVEGDYPLGTHVPSVHKIDPLTDQDVDQIPITNELVWVVVAAGNDAVWAAGNGGRLIRIDPVTDAVTDVRSLGLPPVGMTLDDRGRVWVATGNGEVLILDPATGRTVDTVVAGGASEALTGNGEIDALLTMTFADGIVWVVSKSGGEIDRVVAQSDSRLAPLPVGQKPTGVAVGYGSVWVSVNTSR
jgi:class 3 adenylate cyclase/streptogramin lyase